MTTIIVFVFGVIAGGVAAYLKHDAINEYLQNWTDDE